MTLANDSVVAQTIHISAPSHFTLQLNDDERLGIKRITGYFLLNNEKPFGGMQTTLRLLPIYNIRLIKMRTTTSKQPKELSEPNKIDSAVTIDNREQWTSENDMPQTR